MLDHGFINETILFIEAGKPFNRIADNLSEVAYCRFGIISGLTHEGDGRCDLLHLACGIFASIVQRNQRIDGGANRCIRLASHFLSGLVELLH